MSDQQNARGTESQKVRTEAAAWMQRREFWEWGPEQEAEFERWFKASPSHQVAYLRVKAMWAQTDRLTALRRSVRPDAVAPSNRKWILRARVAAALVIVGVVGGLAFRGFAAFGEQKFATAIGDHKIITLSDGSKIELNTNSVLRLSKTGRQAWLDRGEAYFQVAHDAQHPFSVMVAGRRVEDLGTKFLVRAESGKLIVGLFEGKVSIKASGAPDAAQLAVLTPGDVATDTARGLKVTTRMERTLSNALAWRQNMLIFSNTPLTDVAAQLNRYNTRKVVIEDPSLAQLKIDASIPTNGVDAFVRVARNYLGLRVESREGEIIISR